MNCRKNFCTFASTTVEYMQVNTVSELIYWSYANLAMAHNSVERGVDTYDRTSFMIRSRLYKGLTNGTMQIRSFFDDERYKLENGTHCVYCGSQTNISVDHMFAKAHGGADSSDNLVCCCRSCNSSKGDSDLMEWYGTRNDFPPLLVLRRYLKLVYQFCSESKILDMKIEMLDDSGWPFKLKNIPTNYPSPKDLRL